MTITEAQRLLETANRLSLMEDSISLNLAGLHHDRIRRWIKEQPDSPEIQALVAQMPRGYINVPH